MIDLKPCPYCGGKPEYKHKTKKLKLTIGASIKAKTEERYIRCSKCHARTQAHGKISNIENAWNAGAIYEICGNTQN